MCFRTLKLDISQSNTNCETDACGINAIQQVIQDNDSIIILNNQIDIENSNKLIELISQNSTSNLTLIGAPTTIILDDQQINLNNSNRKFINLNFIFGKKLIKCHSSQIEIKSSNFHSKDGADFAIEATHSKITVQNMNLKNFSNFINSFDSEIYLNNCQITDITECNIPNGIYNSKLFIEKINIQNIKVLNLFSLTNSLSIIESMNIIQSNFDALIMVHNSSLEIANSTFAHNKGNIVNGTQNSDILLDECSIMNHFDTNILFLIDSNCSLTFSDSSIDNIKSNNFINASNSDVDFSNFAFKNSEFQNGLILKQGKISINRLKCSNIISYVFIDAHLCDLFEIINSKFSHFSSNDIINSSIIKASSTKSMTCSQSSFIANVIQPISFCSVNGNISECLLDLNTVLPSITSNISIVNLMECQNFSFVHNKFQKNVAQTGCIFAINSGLDLFDNTFIENEAISGTIMNTIDATLNIKEFDIKYNIAVEKSLFKFSRSTLNILNGNLSNDEASIFIQDRSVAIIDNVVIGSSKEYSIKITDESDVILKKIKSLESFNKTVYIEDSSNLTLKSAQFDCQNKCVTLNGISGKIEQKASQNSWVTIVAILLLIIIILLVSCLVIKKRILRKLPGFMAKYSRNKGNYEL